MSGFMPIQKKGLGDSNLPLSASQSSIFSAEKSKIFGTSTAFVRAKGTGESQFQLTAADLISILSVENRADAPLHDPLPKTPSPGHRLSRGIPLLPFRANDVFELGLITSFMHGTEPTDWCNIARR